MSAFFVHDLKNTASTLSLMLQNLPSRFDDPTFRQDALRAISKSVSHINELIRRLGQLRQKLDLKLVPSDLNEIATRSAAALDGPDAARLVQDLQPLPRVLADPDQIEKVVINLLLTPGMPCRPRRRPDPARDQPAWPLGGLAVTDSGCGMSANSWSVACSGRFRRPRKPAGIGMFRAK